MKPTDLARQRAEMPSGTGGILNSRTLASSHRRLLGILRPGMGVLDIGCGTGAITRGIAEAVGPNGSVVGADIHSGFIGEAMKNNHDLSNLRFVVADAYSVPFRKQFDIVAAARVLQWLSDPRKALLEMARAAKPRGTVLILDYNHDKIEWRPDPPRSMRIFYEAFLQWREDAGMDNRIADHLASMLHQLGLEGIQETPQHEHSCREDADFANRIGIWAEVAASRGYQMVADGMIDEQERATAEADYRAWVHNSAQSQRLYLLAVEGRTTEAI